MTDPELDARLARLAEPDPTIDPGAARDLVRFAAEPARMRHRGRKRWSIAVGALVVGALAIPTAAVAERMFAAQTGEIDDGSGTESTAGEEWIDTGAPDFEECVSSIAPRRLPTPAGFDWDAEAASVAERYSAEPALIQEGGLVADLERTLWLAWLAEWIDADRAGDDSGREAALAVMREAPTWPEIVDSDGGGIRYLMWAFLARMNTGDPAERTNAAQALLQQDAVDILAAQLELSSQQDGQIAEEALLERSSPTLRAAYALWDGVDRQPFIDEMFDRYAELISPYGDISVGSPFWDDYDAALREIAAEAGVEDPAAAVGRGGWGHQDDEGGAE
ncbi:MAG: hypothetical protein QM606_00680 [Leucobacter sp.]